MLAHFLCDMPLSGDHGGAKKGKNRRRPKTPSQRQAELAVLDDIRLDKSIDESLLEMAMEKSLTEPHESHLLDMVIKMSLTAPAPQCQSSNAPNNGASSSSDANTNTDGQSCNANINANANEPSGEQKPAANPQEWQTKWEAPYAT